MAKKPKDIWGIPFPDADDVVEFMNRTVRTGQVASGDREALPGTADSYLNVRGVGQAISQVNDLANPYANTTKQRFSASDLSMRAALPNVVNSVCSALCVWTVAERTREGESLPFSRSFPVSGSTRRE